MPWRDREAAVLSDGSPTSDPGAVIVLGGGSEIGTAIAAALVRRGARTVVLAGRNHEAMRAAATAAGIDAALVETTTFEARATETHATAVEEAFRLAGGPVQAVVVAFAVLGDTDAFEVSPTLAGGAATVNFAGAVSASLAAARALARQESPGTIVVLSSAAMLRPRRSNYVYGAAKAGLDFFARGLADSYGGRVRVLVVRPGLVRTKMTADLPRRPLETTAARVARDVLNSMDRGRRVCWSPGILRLAAVPIRLAPEWLVRRFDTRRSEPTGAE
ncbi:MAG: SDR family NAD(P)-dependent oxidoreductase [Dehalococcoidia bacterium]